MSAAPDVRRALAAARFTKGELVARERQRVDLSPVVEHYREGERVAVVHATGEAEVPETPIPVTSIVLAAAGWRSEELVMVIEVVARRQPSAAPRPAPGDIVRDFAENPYSDAVECLFALHARAGCELVETWTAPYRYVEVPGGIEVEWLDERGPSTGTGGGSAVLRRAVDLADDDPARQLWAVLDAAGDTEAKGGRDRLVAELVASMFGHDVALEVP